MRLGEVVHLVFARVHAARCHFVQQRFPEMRSGVLYQCDACSFAPAEAIAEPGDEFKPRRTAAYHNDLVEIVFNWPISTVRHDNCRVVPSLTLQHVCHPDYSE
jgi:hypothetical protein